MGRSSWMKRFLARLRKSDLQDAPPPELWAEAGRLCQRLQHSPTGLEKLARALAQGRHWPRLCTSLQVVRACVSVHLQKNQHDVACKLLEGCSAIEKEQLVQLWHEIHYRRTMEKRQVTSLTPVQRYRCRQRNPPPASLCPGGVKSRNYPLDVRERLRRFAAEVTAYPSQKQREALARETSLQPHRVYCWFANFRRRQRPVQPADATEPKRRQREGRAAGAPAAGALSGGAGVEESKQPLLALPSAAQGGAKQNSSAPGRPLGELDRNRDPPGTVPEPALAPSVPEVKLDLTPPSRSVGVQCSLCCPSNLPTWPDGARMPGAYGDAGPPKSVRESADWQMEALVLSRGQLLGSWPIPNLPPSSSPGGPVSIEPCPEENQDVARAQDDALLHQGTSSRAGVGEQAEGPPPPAYALPPLPGDVNFQHHHQSCWSPEMYPVQQAPPSPHMDACQAYPEPVSAGDPPAPLPYPDNVGRNDTRQTPVDTSAAGALSVTEPPPLPPGAVYYPVVTDPYTPPALPGYESWIPFVPAYHCTSPRYLAGPSYGNSARIHNTVNARHFHQVTYVTSSNPGLHFIAQSM